MHIMLQALSLLVVVQLVTVMNVNYQRSKLGSEQNRALSAKNRAIIITAKISGNALKQGSRTHSVVRQRSSQLQNQRRSQNEVEVATPLPKQTI